MAQFDPIRTGDQMLDRIQTNIAKALNQSESSKSGVETANSVNFVVRPGTSALFVPTNSISGASSGVNIILPDAVANPGMIFFWKKTDTSSNALNFSSSAKNQHGNQQSVENSSTYSVSTSLAQGRFVSDGNNWWLV